MAIVSFALEKNHVDWLKMKKDRYGVSASQMLRDILDDEIRRENQFGETQWFKTETAMVRALEKEQGLS